MANFHSTFFSIGNSEDFSADAWRPYFLNFDTQKWNEDMGGSIQYIDGQCNYSLIMNYVEGKILSISYSVYCASDFSRNISYISLNKIDSMNDFLISKNATTLPIGSCIVSDLVWNAVESFLNDPVHLPVTIQWTNSKDIVWGEDF